MQYILTTDAINYTWELRFRYCQPMPSLYNAIIPLAINIFTSVLCFIEGFEVWLHLILFIVILLHTEDKRQRSSNRYVTFACGQKYFKKKKVYIYLQNICLKDIIWVRDHAKITESKHIDLVTNSAIATLSEVFCFSFDPFWYMVIGASYNSLRFRSCWLSHW